MDSNFLVNNNNSFQTYIQLSLKEWLLVDTRRVFKIFFLIFLVNGKIIEEDENRIFNVHEGKNINTQSTRKLSNFNFEWTKNL